jgi:hypothetical protein
MVNVVFLKSFIVAYATLRYWSRTNSFIFLAQINRAAAKLASTASAAAELVSYGAAKSLPTTTGLDLSRRRGSLPSNLVRL